MIFSEISSSNFPGDFQDGAPSNYSAVGRHYDPPGSPLMAVFRPNLRDKLYYDRFQLESYVSDSDEEVDDFQRRMHHIPEVRLTRGTHDLRERLNKQKRKYERILIDTMDPDLRWKMDENVLFEPLPKDERRHKYVEDFVRHRDFHTIPEAIASNREARRLMARRRVCLPLILQSKKGPIEVMACPDTGSDNNIVSLKLAKDLGLHLENVDEPKEFMLANGKKVTPLRKSSLPYSFGPGNPTVSQYLVVYVLDTLVVPIVLGIPFLQETETFTKLKDLLVAQIVPAADDLRVNCVHAQAPKRGIVCRLDSFVTCAKADTGSDLDLVSLQFAEKRGFVVHPGCERLEFADGSRGQTFGSLLVTFEVGELDSVRGFQPCARKREWEFHVLDNLPSDVVIGQSTLEDLEVLDQGIGSLIRMPPAGLSDCQIIRHIGRIERIIGTGLKTIGGIFSDSKDKTRSRIKRQLEEEEKRNAMKELLEIQRENARKEAEISKAESKPVGPFFCEFAGCSAPPFSTKSLLDLHSRVHAATRPYCCPIAGCPRGTTGRGYIHQEQLERHALSHNTPGSVCPRATASNIHQEQLERHVDSLNTPE